MKYLSTLAVLALGLLLAACSRAPQNAQTQPTADAPANAEPQQPATREPDASSPTPPAETQAHGTTVQQTKQQPTLRVMTLDGDTYDLADQRGHWVVVNFWATWCAPCLKEMPELSALHAMRGNIRVVGLAYEDTEADELKAFLQKHPVTYPIAQLDTYNPPHDFATPRGLPTTYLIDPQGRLAHEFVGPVTAHDIEAAVEESGKKG